ncbi:hypothetical protein ABKN59_004739 [Abortiporus biennis]
MIPRSSCGWTNATSLVTILPFILAAVPRAFNLVTLRITGIRAVQLHAIAVWQCYTEEAVFLHWGATVTKDHLVNFVHVIRSFMTEFCSRRRANWANHRTW